MILFYSLCCLLVVFVCYMMIRKIHWGWRVMAVFISPFSFCGILMLSLVIGGDPNGSTGNVPNWDDIKLYFYCLAFSFACCMPIWKIHWGWRIVVSFVLSFAFYGGSTLFFLIRESSNETNRVSSIWSDMDTISRFFMDK